MSMKSLRSSSSQQEIKIHAKRDFSLLRASTAQKQSSPVWQSTIIRRVPYRLESIRQFPQYEPRDSCAGEGLWGEECTDGIQQQSLRRLGSGVGLQAVTCTSRGRSAQLVTEHRAAQTAVCNCSQTHLTCKETTMMDIVVVEQRQCCQKLHDSAWIQRKDVITIITYHKSIRPLFLYTNAENPTSRAT